ncbi:hypothetical protein [Absidia glauca]|uniref:Uncharacterized protein n=1 Tax=Absidia glauca TaxID=4829 RepID=A0A163MM92_ABSGL|nr:hypothetical protein [Absidia glauca]
MFSLSQLYRIKNLTFDSVLSHDYNTLPALIPEDFQPWKFDLLHMWAVNPGVSSVYVASDGSDNVYERAAEQDVAGCERRLI